MWQQPYAMQFSMNFLDENAYEVRIYDRKLCGSGGKSGSRDVIVGRRDSPGETADAEGH